MKAHEWTNDLGLGFHCVLCHRFMNHAGHVFRNNRADGLYGDELHYPDDRVCPGAPEERSSTP